MNNLAHFLSGATHTALTAVLHPANLSHVALTNPYPPPEFPDEGPYALHLLIFQVACYALAALAFVSLLAFVILGNVCTVVPCCSSAFAAAPKDKIYATSSSGTVKQLFLRIFQALLVVLVLGTVAGDFFAVFAYLRPGIAKAFDAQDSQILKFTGDQLTSIQLHLYENEGLFGKLERGKEFTDLVNATLSMSSDPVMGVDAFMLKNTAPALKSSLSALQASIDALRVSRNDLSFLTTDALSLLPVNNVSSEYTAKVGEIREFVDLKGLDGFMSAFNRSITQFIDAQSTPSLTSFTATLNQYTLQSVAAMTDDLLLKFDGDKAALLDATKAELENEAGKLGAGVAQCKQAVALGYTYKNSLNAVNAKETNGTAASLAGQQQEGKSFSDYTPVLMLLRPLSRTVLFIVYGFLGALTLLCLLTVLIWFFPPPSTSLSSSTFSSKFGRAARCGGAGCGAVGYGAKARVQYTTALLFWVVIVFLVFAFGYLASVGVLIANGCDATSSSPMSGSGASLGLNETAPSSNMTEGSGALMLLLPPQPPQQGPQQRQKDVCEACTKSAIFQPLSDVSKLLSDRSSQMDVTPSSGLFFLDSLFSVGLSQLAAIQVNAATPAADEGKLKQLESDKGSMTNATLVADLNNMISLTNAALTTVQSRLADFKQKYADTVKALEPISKMVQAAGSKMKEKMDALRVGFEGQKLELEQSVYKPWTDEGKICHGDSGNGGDVSGQEAAGNDLPSPGGLAVTSGAVEEEMRFAICSNTAVGLNMLIMMIPLQVIFAIILTIIGMKSHAHLKNLKEF